MGTISKLKDKYNEYQTPQDVQKRLSALEKTIKQNKDKVYKRLVNDIQTRYKQYGISSRIKPFEGNKDFYRDCLSGWAKYFNYQKKEYVEKDKNLKTDEKKRYKELINKFSCFCDTDKLDIEISLDDMIDIMVIFISSFRANQNNEPIRFDFKDNDLELFNKINNKEFCTISTYLITLGQKYRQDFNSIGEYTEKAGESNG